MPKINIRYLFTVLLLSVMCTTTSASAKDDKSSIIKQCLGLQHNAFITNSLLREHQILAIVRKRAPDIAPYVEAQFKQSVKQSDKIHKASVDLISHHHDWLRGKNVAEWSLFSYGDNKELSKEIVPLVPPSEILQKPEIIERLKDEYGHNDPHLSELMNDQELSKVLIKLKVQAIEDAGAEGEIVAKGFSDQLVSIDCFNDTEKSLQILGSLKDKFYFEDKETKRNTPTKKAEQKRMKDNKKAKTSNIYTPSQKSNNKPVKNDGSSNGRPQYFIVPSN